MLLRDVVQCKQACGAIWKVVNENECEEGAAQVLKQNTKCDADVRLLYGIRGLVPQM